jgi:hypothetical protein
MPRNRSILIRLLLSLVVCLLLCAILSAELPELVALSDNTSNDFTVRKGGARESLATLNFAVHKSVSSNVMNFRNDDRTHSSFFASAGPISSDLIPMHSVLRR